MNAIERIRAALAALSDYNHDTNWKYRVAFNRACNPAAMAEVLAHIDAQQARIHALETARYAYASEFELDEDGCPDKGSIHQNIRKLKAEIERLRADAVRYQWLRNQHWTNNTLCVVARPKDAMRIGHDAPSGDRLDELIDAAMKCESSESEGCNDYL